MSMKSKMALLSAFALFGGMNQTGLTSNPVPYTGVSGGADPPDRMTPEEIKAELDKRYTSFLKDIELANQRRLEMSSKARKKLKPFELYPGVIIIAKTPQKADQLFRKYLAENNLILEKKKDEDPTEIPGSDPVRSGDS